MLSSYAQKGIGFALPLIVAFLLSGILLVIIGENPVKIYSMLVNESFGSSRRIAATLSASTPLLFTAVATAICFRSGAFNVGVEGAFLIGGLGAVFCGFFLPVQLGLSIIPIAIIFAGILGGIWLYFPGYLLAKFEVDEVVSTLMLNFIAIAITGYLINGPLLSPTSGNNVTPVIHDVAKLPRLMPPSTLHGGFILGLISVSIYGLWCNRSSSGFESALIGLNQRFSRAVGISVQKTLILVMVLSGIIGGIGGASHGLGQLYRFSDGFSPGYGFTGMAVALLARNSPIGIIAGSILFGALASAGTTIQLFSDIPLDLINIIQGTVMIFAVIEIARLSLRKKIRAEL